MKKPTFRITEYVVAFIFHKRFNFSHWFPVAALWGHCAVAQQIQANCWKKCRQSKREFCWCDERL